MTKHRIVLWIAAACIAASPYLVTAQPEPARPAATAAAGSAAPADRPGPLPANFGKIAVNDQQREQLYKIQDEYEARIDGLQRQIKALLQEREQKMEAVLTPGQKLRLAELKAEAKARAEQSRPAAPPAQPQ
jgi:hypothetical protein